MNLKLSDDYDNPIENDGSVTIKARNEDREIQLTIKP